MIRISLLLCPCGIRKSWRVIAATPLARSFASSKSCSVSLVPRADSNHVVSDRVFDRSDPFVPSERAAGWMVACSLKMVILAVTVAVYPPAAPYWYGFAAAMLLYLRQVIIKLGTIRHTVTQIRLYHQSLPNSQVGGTPPGASALEGSATSLPARRKRTPTLPVPSSLSIGGPNPFPFTHIEMQVYSNPWSMGTRKIYRIPLQKIMWMGYCRGLEFKKWRMIHVLGFSKPFILNVALNKQFDGILPVIKRGNPMFFTAIIQATKLRHFRVVRDDVDADNSPLSEPEIFRL